MERRSRSSAYQYLLVETACSNDMMEAFCNEDSIYNRLNPFDYNENLLELEDQLKVEFWRVVDTLLTERQRDIIKLYADGLTQMEIAKILKVNQSSVTKSLNGNVDYKNKGKNKNKSKRNRSSYGGSVKKIKKIIESDPKIKEILEKMVEIRNLKW